MEVVVYKVKGKNGYLYDMSFNPCVDFEILRNTRNIKTLEVLTPKIPIINGEEILNRIYKKSILKKFITKHEFFIKNGLKKLKLTEIHKNITEGTTIPTPENIAIIENCIMGKVMTVNKLLAMEDLFNLSGECIRDIIQTLYCERRIKMVPATRLVKKKLVCSFCEKVACEDCCLGFNRGDILLYAADNYNLGIPHNIGFKKKKMSEALNKACDGINNFIVNNKKKSAVLWCVPSGFEYAVMTEALASVIMTGGKVLIVTGTSSLYEAKEELGITLDGASVVVTDKNDFSFKDSDITICSYANYPCFHKAFDLVIYDERMSYLEKPITNMLAISSRAVKEKGKLINITNFPDTKDVKATGNATELITIPVTNTRAPIPEPLIVISRLLKESLPQIVIDSVKWSIEDNLKMIIFVPNEESKMTTYNYLISMAEIKKEEIDFSDEKDKSAIIRLKRRDIQIVISTDIKDVNCRIEDLNVIVMNADNINYSGTSLLHMASMADLHTKKKCGQVIFAVEKETEEVTGTKDKIRGINKIAWESGFIKK